MDDRVKENKVWKKRQTNKLKNTHTHTHTSSSCLGIRWHKWQDSLRCSLTLWLDLKANSIDYSDGGWGEGGFEGESVSAFLSEEGIIPEHSALTQTWLKLRKRVGEIGWNRQVGYKTEHTRKKKKVNRDSKRPGAQEQRTPRTYLFTMFQV